MTLDEFIATKPPELRLGQWFYNCYLHKLQPEDQLHHNTQFLYNTTNDIRAEMYIEGLMMCYQWEELPEYE